MVYHNGKSETCVVIMIKICETEENLLSITDNEKIIEIESIEFCKKKKKFFCLSLK